MNHLEMAKELEDIADNLERSSTSINRFIGEDNRRFAQRLKFRAHQLREENSRLAKAGPDAA